MFRVPRELAAQDSLEERAQQAFNRADANSDGYVDRLELRSVLLDFGVFSAEEIDDAKVGLLFDEIDRDGSGLIDFEEFAWFHNRMVAEEEAQLAWAPRLNTDQQLPVHSTLRNTTSWVEVAP